jgi:hypothetical protein
MGSPAASIWGKGGAEGTLAQAAKVSAAAAGRASRIQFEPRVQNSRYVILRSSFSCGQGWAKIRPGSRRKKVRFACNGAQAQEEKFSGEARKKSHGTKIGADGVWR